MNNNRIFALAVGAIAVVSLVVIALGSAFREPVEVDPESPEATVQTFLQAVLDEDVTTAHSLLTADLQEDCTLSDLASGYIDDVVQATVDGDVVIEDGEAVVKIALQHSSGDVLSSSRWEETVVFVLIDSSGEWAIDEVGWPWTCGRIGP